MALSRPARAGFVSLPLFAAALVAVALIHTPDATPQQKKAKAQPKGAAEELLKIAPRPKKEALPPSKLPLELVRGERIAFVGNSTAERFNLFGHFETLLQSRFKDKELVVRNFARPADEVGLRQRPSDYTK